ncbi:MAG: glucoamylase family protein, partial [Acholeplasmataceae bacterium]|nr:glucoamylase family protein [Acholeplasmataceae bacterium]
TLRDHVPHHDGFFAHYIDIHSAERLGKTEYSTIDTALCLCGVIAVDAYFKDDKLSHIAHEILDRVDYGSLVFEKEGKKVLHMAYNPDKGGDYVVGKPGYIHHWSMFAEQLMMYVFMAGSKHHEHAKEVYDSFEKNEAHYEGITYIYSPGNSLFVYQFPLAWLDLKHITDDHGINWFENAIKATLAHEKAARLHEATYPSFKPHYFGFSASDTPRGYRVYGGIPNSTGKLDTDGTVTPHAMIGSLILTPDLSLQAMRDMDLVEGLDGPYGYYDGFLIDDQKWISQRYISIDKGLELLMLSNYLSQTIHNVFMKHPIVQKGMEVLGWKKI